VIAKFFVVLPKARILFSQFHKIKNHTGFPPHFICLHLLEPKPLFLHNQSAETNASLNSAIFYQIPQVSLLVLVRRAKRQRAVYTAHDFLWWRSA
jgi:hypothetical protein